MSSLQLVVTGDAVAAVAARDYYAHESCYVDEPCVIGRGTRIWHFSHVMKDCVIGRNCRLGQNVSIHSGVVIGDNVKIQNNVSVYSGVTLEDDVFCGPSVVFTNILTPRSAYPRNRAEDYHATRVGRGASIGANATIVCGRTLGEHCLVGAGSVVTKDVLPYAMVYGNPARRAGWVCECGIPLQFTRDAAVCAECGRMYRQYEYVQENTRYTRISPLEKAK
jgi:UDP-2-acetamido-3-amino-2,3-dideoxy-glucuronate N-acetyltransferase